MTRTPSAANADTLDIEIDSIEEVVSLEISEDARMSVRAHAANILSLILRQTDDFKELWNRLSALASATDSSILHGQRDRLEFGYRIKIANFLRGFRLAEQVEAKTGASLTEAAELPISMQELKDFAVPLFARWSTERDLDEILTEQAVSRMKRLDGAFPDYLKAPQAWYEDDSNPFTAE